MAFFLGKLLLLVSQLFSILCANNYLSDVTLIGALLYLNMSKLLQKCSRIIFFSFFLKEIFKSSAENSCFSIMQCTYCKQEKMLQCIYSNIVQPSDTNNFNNILNYLDPATYNKQALLLFTAVVCHLQFLSFYIIWCLHI